MKDIKLIRLTLMFILGIILLLYIWIYSHFFGYLLGSVFIVNFMREIFKIRKFYNRKMYLTLSAIILSLGVILSILSLINMNLNFQVKIIDTLIIVVMIVIAFYAIFRTIREWGRLEIIE